ncbi:MAG: hypothetical protein PHS24_00095 [Bacilli bacterium]|nr:hypothetical protein [Bacilli bacterium]
MEKRHKTYFKLNFVSLLFMAISFISATLAWFAYSGIAGVSTEVNVKAWNIELSKNGTAVKNSVVMSLSEIYPGMEPVTELITLRNLGDSDAEINYDIISARILGDPNDFFQIDVNGVTSEYMEDLISHEYPFNININLSKNYILSNGTEEVFEIAVSWPLDSGNDELDSLWGNKAHEFQEGELLKKQQDENYQILPSVQVEISLSAQQYLDIDSSSDPRYNLGDEILIDVINNNECFTISDTCIKTYVIDENNTLGDTKVTLLLNPLRTYDQVSYNNYVTIFNTYVSSWHVTTRYLLVEDIMKIISNDIKNSQIIINSYSDKVLGYINYNNRLNTLITNTINKNGFFRFMNDKYNFLSSNNCYWTQSSYGELSGFALVKIDDTYSKVYGNLKESTCNVIPVIEIDKSRL